MRVCVTVRVTVCECTSKTHYMPALVFLPGCSKSCARQLFCIQSIGTLLGVVLLKVKKNKHSDDSLLKVIQSNFKDKAINIIKQKQKRQKQIHTKTTTEAMKETNKETKTLNE